MPIIRIEDPKVFVGLSVEAARKEIAEHGYDVRVQQASLMYKPDYDPLRIVLIVSKDKVTDAFVG